MPRSRGARLGIREARLITKELRLLGIPPQTIAKMWVIVIAIPVIFILGYLAVRYDSGTADPAVLARVQITYKDNYLSHVHNDTGITLKSLTVTCFPGGDAQPETSTTTLYPPLVLTENSVRSENTGVPTIREIMVATTMRSLFVALFALVASSFRTRAALQAEILALRHQLAVFQRNAPRRLRLHRCDRLLWVVLYRCWSGWRRCLEIVQPDTVLRWHRRAFA